MRHAGKHKSSRKEMLFFFFLNGFEYFNAFVNFCFTWSGGSEFLNNLTESQIRWKQSRKHTAAT